MLKRSVTIAGHRTSIALEPEFWAALDELAARAGLTTVGLIAQIDGGRGTGNLASALRVHVLRRLSEVTAAAAQPASGPAAGPAGQSPAA